MFRGSLAKLKKISIVGNSAAGKSTLAHTLGQSLGLDVFSIDKIYWLAGWKRRDRASFKQRHGAWLAQESWIIEGVGYWEEMTHRMAESDAVIFLDAPIALCMARAAIRINQEASAPNANITAGCAYTEVEALQMEVIERFHSELRPRLLKYLSGFSPEKVKVLNHLDEGVTGQTLQALLTTPSNLPET